LVIKIPIGTVIINEETGEQMGDLTVAGQIIIAKGGNGGFGNSHFTSSVRQTPKMAELGEPGEEFNLTLEMKMVADVGFIGLPNVGKSTFLSVVSAARPKIADYEFTTLIPNLGVIEKGTFGADSGFIAADIPGLIEGASEGRGLGDDFLRHIERTKVLVHFLDATHEDLRGDYQTIRAELKNYTLDLSGKPEIVIINKIDAISEEELKKKLDKVQAVVKSKIILISAIAHKNIPTLIHEIEAKLKKLNKEQPAESGIEEFKEFTIEDVKNQNVFEVIKEDEGYRVVGNKIEKFVIRTDLKNPHAVARLRDIMKKLGIDKELRRSGASLGDTVIVKDKKFIF
jgi:GTP-binding protein